MDCNNTFAIDLQQTEFHLGLNLYECSEIIIHNLEKFYYIYISCEQILRSSIITNSLNSITISVAYQPSLGCVMVAYQPSLGWYLRRIVIKYCIIKYCWYLRINALGCVSTIHGSDNVNSPFKVNFLDFAYRSISRGY